MAKYKKFNSGTLVESGTSDFESDPYTRPGPGKKKLPSESIKKDDKPPVEKYIKEPFRKANDKVSTALESVGLTNPVDVIDESFGGETVDEARARRAGMPVGKGTSRKAGGKIVSKVAYKSGGKVRGCGIAQKGLTKGRMV